MNLPFPRFSRLPAAPHRRGFYLVKKGFVRELNIAEIPVEPRVRPNLIPGREREERCPCSPPSRFALSATTPRIYLPYPLVTVRACTLGSAERTKPPRKWAAELDDFRVCSSATDYLFLDASAGTGKRWLWREALCENKAKKLVRNVVSTAVMFAVGSYKVEPVFRRCNLSALRLVSLAGREEY